MHARQIDGSDHLIKGADRERERPELLKKISLGKQVGLSRTKLHQIREAVLRMNLSTSIYEGMAVLRNWRSGQRDLVLREVYPLGNPAPGEPRAAGTFPRVTFPWFADGPETYRTALLDYVELYDYVPKQGGGSASLPPEGEEDDA
jgi:hypothetical protein